MKHQDPVRWTASADDAPEVLRDAFAAGRKEGPSPAHLRALSLKLAAVAAGGGVVAASTQGGAALASSTALKSAFGGLKLLAAVTLAGTAAVGASVFLGSPSEQHAAAPSAGTPAAAPAAAAATSTTERAASNVPSVSPVTSVTQIPSVAPVAAMADSAASGERTDSALVKSDAARAVPSQAKAAARVEHHKAHRAAPAARAHLASPPESAPSAPATTSALAPTTELGLLRRAQAALATRPSEAYALTQEHRKLFPDGQFAQERDALAVQALVRTGKLDDARDLAARFVRAHPESAHAHRFRELFKLP